MQLDQSAKLPKTSDWFDSFARNASTFCGKPLVFLLAVALIVVWAATGPIFKYSDTWQLVINTGTTIVTFLMVFLIQNTQNRDTMAVQVKLSELILAMEGAQNKLANCEELSEKELEALHEKYRGYADTIHSERERRSERKRPKLVKSDSGAEGDKKD
jgi:low affinity Fe/Cu permease